MNKFNMKKAPFHKKYLFLIIFLEQKLMISFYSVDVITDC